MSAGVVLDAGAFIAVENRDKYATALLNAAKQAGDPLATSAGVVGQVWRGGARQAPVARVLKWPSVTVEHLTDTDGLVIGKMLAVSGTSDVVDAHVALLARRRGWPVITSDPDDLYSLDPRLELWQV